MLKRFLRGHWAGCVLPIEDFQEIAKFFSQFLRVIEYIKKIWRPETFSGSSAQMSDSDKVSDSNIEFIKTV